MEMMSGSFRIDEAGWSSSSSAVSLSWRRMQRSNSLLLASELAADSEFAKVAAYRRLSQSMRVSNDSGRFGFLCKPAPMYSRKRRAINWTDKLGKLFSFKGIRDRAQVAVAANKPPEVDVVAHVVGKKKRSSWLPDPDRRWPVQGW